MLRKLSSTRRRARSQGCGKKILPAIFRRDYTSCSTASTSKFLSLGSFSHQYLLPMIIWLCITRDKSWVIKLWKALLNGRRNNGTKTMTGPNLTRFRGKQLSSPWRQRESLSSLFHYTVADIQGGENYFSKWGGYQRCLVCELPHPCRKRSLFGAGWSPSQVWEGPGQACWAREHCQAARGCSAKQTTGSAAAGATESLPVIHRVTPLQAALSREWWAREAAASRAHTVHQTARNEGWHSAWISTASPRGLPGHSTESQLQTHNQKHTWIHRSGVPPQSVGPPLCRKGKQRFCIITVIYFGKDLINTVKP